MPQPMVRQLTDRRLAENVAAMPKKLNAPQAAWPREPIWSRKRYATPPRATTAAAMIARQASGVGGGGGVAGTAAWGNSASGVCTGEDIAAHGSGTGIHTRAIDGPASLPHRPGAD